MSLSKTLDNALQKGVIKVEHRGGKASVDVVAVGPVGVRVRAIAIDRARDVPVSQAAEELVEQLARVLPERIEAVEVDPGLGGAVLRTKPSEMRDGEFVEVEVRGSRSVRVRRWRVDGERVPVDWAMTRDQLGRLVDELV